MRSLILMLSIVALTGCRKVEPTLAGGKPVTHWLQGLNDPDATVRKTAVMKLGNVGPADAAAFPALLNTLEDPDASVRCETIQAMLKFGTRAKDAISVLAALRQGDADAKVREYAAKALTRIEQIR